MSGEGKLVCVTGGSGYTASWLVKFLLLRGYTVNATVRDPSDPKKVQHLLALEGAYERLHLFKAELTEKGSFDASIKGCDGVFHTASPCCLSEPQDPQAELLDPAIEGTLNVLNSCSKFSSVKRVVLTSSMATVVRRGKLDITPEDVVDESWFANPDYLRQHKRWYALSKTLAEQTAWKYAKEKGIDLVSMNPAYVVGPLLQPKLNDSCGIYLDLINAKTYSDVPYRVVHVKDVANAHILAFETASANGRYCLVQSTVHNSDTMKILRELYPTLQLPDKCEDYTIPRVTCHVSSEKAKSLGNDFIPFETSLKEMIDSFKEKNFISF